MEVTLLRAENCLRKNHTQKMVLCNEGEGATSKKTTKKKKTEVHSMTCPSAEHL